MFLENRKGFTLIEFLIALVVIGFIVGLLINYFSNPLSEAKSSSLASKVVQDAMTMSKAVNSYYLANQDYPGNKNDLIPKYMTEDIESKMYPELSHSGWYDSVGTDVNHGDGTSKKYMVLSMGDDPMEIAVCKKINAQVAGMAPDATVPTVGGDIRSWASVPAEIVGHNSFCVYINPTWPAFYMAL